MASKGTYEISQNLIVTFVTQK